MRLSETPAFQRLKHQDAVSHRPMLEVFARVPRTVLIAIGMKISEVAWVYVLTVFSIVYATTKLGLPRSLILNGIIAGALLELITLPVAGALSDRYGRKPIYMAGVALSIVCAFPVFWLLDTRDPAFVIIGLALVMNVTARDRVRDRCLLDAGIVRHPGALHRRIARLPGVGGTEWRIRADHRDRAVGLDRRHLAGFAVSDRSGTDRGRRGGGRERNATPRRSTAPDGLPGQRLTPARAYGETTGLSPVLGPPPWALNTAVSLHRHGPARPDHRCPQLVSPVCLGRSCPVEPGHDDERARR